MERSKAEEAHRLYVNYELMFKAIDTLLNGGQLYAFCSGTDEGFVLPEEIRSDLIRHFNKNKAIILAEIEKL
jgi:hypothetical protein